MGASVATPLENQFSTIAGLESMTVGELARLDADHAGVQLDRSLDGAAVDVQGAITQASRLLPQGMPTPPTFTKVNPADQPILYLVIRSTTLPAWTLDEWAETPHRAAHLAGQRRRPRCRCSGAQKYLGARAARSAQLARARSASTRSKRVARLERQRAGRQHHRPAPRLHAAGHRPADERRRVQEHGRRLPQRRRRSGSTHSDA
jgi:hypothetical protein